MRIYVTIIIVLLAPLISKAQPKESDKIYWEALDGYTRYLDTAYRGSKAVINGKQVIYLKQQDFVDSIPKEINGYKIELINEQNYKHLYKLKGGRLIHTIIFPVKIIAGTAEISIIPYIGTLRRNHLNLAVSNGITVRFNYNCEQRRFLVTKVHGWGI